MKLILNLLMAALLITSSSKAMEYHLPEVDAIIALYNPPTKTDFVKAKALIKQIPADRINKHDSFINGNILDLVSSRNNQFPDQHYEEIIALLKAKGAQISKPIVARAIFYIPKGVMTLQGKLSSYIKEGKPPYRFGIYGQQPEADGRFSYASDAICVFLRPTGEFGLALVEKHQEIGNEYYFPYTITDANGQARENVTIIIGNEKG